MPVKILNCGSLISYDEEDAPAVDARSWHVTTLFPSNRSRVSANERRHNRMYRVTLHRTVAIRMRPDLVTRKLKFRVFPKNGDYLDCRRDNLEVVQLEAHRPGRKGTEPRPKGWLARPVTKPILNQSPPSDLWAGGYEYKALNRTYKGEGYRARKCLAGKPVD